MTNHKVEPKIKIIDNFVNHVFKEDNTEPYVYITNLFKSLYIEEDKRKLKRTLIKIIIKHIKKRFKNIVHREIKQDQIEVDHVGVIVREYVLFFGILDALKKIFFMVDFYSDIAKYINKKIKIVIERNEDVLVSEISKKIYSYEIEKDNPQYVISITQPRNGVRTGSLKKNLSPLECLILIFEIFKDIENGGRLTESIINIFIQNWTKDAVEGCKDIEQLTTSIKSLRRNIVLKERIHFIEQSIVTILISKFSTLYISNAVGFKHSVGKLEYFYELTEKTQDLISILQQYISIRYEGEQTFIGHTDILKIIDYCSNNIKIQNNVSVQNQNINKQILFNLTKVIKNKIYTGDVLNQQKGFDFSFIQLFSFYLETLTWTSFSGIIKNEIDQLFKSYVLKNEVLLVKSVINQLDFILRGTIDVYEIFYLVFMRELSFIRDMSHDSILFGDCLTVKKIVCCDLLCPISIALNSFGVEVESLTSSERDVFLRNAFFKFVTVIFDIIEDKEIFDLLLREKLGARLIGQSFNPQYERDFISCVATGVNKTIGDRLNNMINDYENRSVYKNSEIMCLKQYQWPYINVLDADIDELNKLKKDYVDQRSEPEKIRIRWADGLSSCEVLIGDKSVCMSVLQYEIFMDIYKTGKFDCDKKKQDNQSIYKIHLNELISRGLIKGDGGRYEIDFDCSEINFFSVKSFAVEKLLIKDEGDNKKYNKALLDCKIMRCCKSVKTINIKDLQITLNIDRMILNGRIDELKRKGYLEVKGDDVVYIP